LAIQNLDYNLFEPFSSFPVLEKLDTLSINSNNLLELPDSSKFPNLDGSFVTQSERKKALQTKTHKLSVLGAKSPLKNLKSPRTT